MTTCYLTIDDSPSPHTDAMVDFLRERNIPALLFARGDMIDKYGTSQIVRAIQQGFVIGNHSYSHQPFGELSYEEAIADIEACEALINQCYDLANVKRLGKYFRFPYLDRGDGDRIERHFEKVTNIDINDNIKIKEIQKFLEIQGFKQPFKTNNLIYSNPSIAQAKDCLMTFTSYDWMLTDRHIGKWEYKNIDDLKARIDQSDIKKYDGNILIFHDQTETFETFKSLIDHMVLKGYEFLSMSS